MASVALPHTELTDRQLLLAIFQRQEIQMATLTELVAQIRDGIVKERDDHQRALAELRATLEDQTATAEAARDQALTDLAAAQADAETASGELVGLVDELASNDLPDVEIPTEPEEPELPEEPTDPTDPTDPETPGEEPETPTEPDDGTTEPPVLGDGDGDQPTNPPNINPGEVVQ